ncbi:helix-turn-helix domain-containing protein [Aquitalea pelogenes]|uniref:helix-turn-helix domain-containing protein n=1 Tax=Aquitalea pelogenes TaxID=1293573 RepID=UPI00078767D3|nr:helix-turn-helix transcriptional regulator [Aquitalea pelogenes]
MIGKTRPTLAKVAEPARGVLNLNLSEARFTHLRSLPSEQLSTWVEHYWYVGWDFTGQPPQQQQTLPHPNVHLVIEDGQAHLWGPRRLRFSKTLSGRAWAFGIKFRPASFQPFLNGAVHHLANRIIPASEIFGTRVSRLTGNESWPEMGDLMDQAEALLLGCLPQISPLVPQLNELVAEIARNSALTSVAQLSALSGWSERQLQRLFAHYIGVSPKAVLARYRLHEALALMQSTMAPAWTELALRLGYFDQAHFIRDFTRMVGQPPRKYVQAQCRD